MGQTLVEGVSKSDSIRFVAGVTHSSSDRARAFASSRGFSLRPAYEVVLGDPKIDAVVLVTPDFLHADQVVAAARAGKHVFCEKPLVLTKADAERAASAIEAAMAFPNALFLGADQWRASREESPCGGLMPMGVHAVDGMIDLCGLVDEVYCQSFRRVVEIDADQDGLGANCIWCPHSDRNRTAGCWHIYLIKAYDL